ATYFVVAHLPLGPQPRDRSERILPMKKWLKRWVVALALTAGAVGLGVSQRPWASVAHAQDQQLATADDLKGEALKALRAGQFDRPRDLLTKAASLDRSLTRWADWSSQFETQRQGFVSERRKQYDKAVEEVQKLVAAHKDAYVIDYARTAHLLADDK